MTTQAVTTTPRPELTPDLTFLTSNTYVLICDMPIIDVQLIWTPMTTDHPSNDHPSGHDHPQTWIDPGIDIPNLNYLCFDMQHAHSWWQNDLDTYDHPKNDHPGCHDHSQTLVDPGFDIPDLNYPQLDTKNVKIGPREGVIRFWTKIVFLDHCAPPPKHNIQIVF